MKRVTMAVQLALVAILASAALGCGGDEGPESTEVARSSVDAEASKESFAFAVPDANSLQGLPGGFLTFRLADPDRRSQKVALPADDPLHAAFQLEAAAARERMTHGSHALAEVLAKDPKAESLWTSCIARVITAESLEQENGTWLVVLQADLLPLIRHVRGPTSRARDGD